MFQLIALTLFVLGCNGQEYLQLGTGSGLSSGQQLGTKGLPAPLPPAPVLSKTRQAFVAPQQSFGPVDAAIHSRRTFEFRHVSIPENLAQPQVIEVGAGSLPIHILFRSASSPLSVQQVHTAGLQAPVEYGQFQEHPHRLVNEVMKPVIQEVREVIQPYRRVTQEVRPVIEEVHTVVHKGDKRVAEPLALKQASAAFGAGAGLVAAKGYKAAKAA